MKLVEFTLDNDSFFCPVTGNNMYVFDCEGLQSPAMQFLMLGYVGEFICEDPEIEAIYQACAMEAIEKGVLTTDLMAERFKDKDNWLCFIINTGSGPSCATNYFCFDMNYQAA